MEDENVSVEHGSVGSRKRKKMPLKRDLAKKVRLVFFFELWVVQLQNLFFF